MKYYVKVAENGDIIGSMADDTGRIDKKTWLEVPNQVYHFRDGSGNSTLKWDGSKITKKAGYKKAKWDELRRVRDSLLAQCDFLVLPDSPLTASEKTAWRDYRQSLRDLPATYTDPDKVVWPTKPE